MNLWRLALAQLASGVGIASGIAVGAVLVEEISGSTQLAGLSTTATVLGAGLLAFPLSSLATLRGRRTALGLGFVLGALGAVLILLGVEARLTLVMFLGLALLGSPTASGLQARYAATDDVPAGHRARAMSVVVWATTIGSVAGPQLSAPGAALGRQLGINALSGPYLFSVVAFSAAALLAWTMRPPGVPLDQSRGERRVSMGDCIGAALSQPRTALGMAAVVAGQMMMTCVMVMTPLHMHHQGQGLKLVGIVISSHILGMYALSPVVGWATDRWGSITVIAVGMGLFALAFGIGILDALGESALSKLIPALVLLGLGWSCTLIAGSSLVGQSTEAELRVPMQGTVDTLMNIGAAAITAVAGSVLAWQGFVGINVMAFLVWLVLLIFWLRR